MLRGEDLHSHDAPDGPLLVVEPIQFSDEFLVEGLCMESLELVVFAVEYLNGFLLREEDVGTNRSRRDSVPVAVCSKQALVFLVARFCIEASGFFNDYFYPQADDFGGYIEALIVLEGDHIDDFAFFPRMLFEFFLFHDICFFVGFSPGAISPCSSARNRPVPGCLPDFP